MDLRSAAIGPIAVKKIYSYDLKPSGLIIDFSVAYDDEIWAE